ncbi:MAG: T9SS C-terminal target domain-containing protein, partial [Haliscomenobacteraceae bacterium CHB4]|nr:T9SS C-terminal target domain-containing protein [Haliscomenobacteraceae bacterium CHB4]
DASCFGAADGAAAVVAAGGDGSYSFLWSNGETTPAVANLPAGIYSVTATDDENCTATATVIITQPDPLMANASTTPPSVIGAADGTATANPQGGTAPYTFLWNNGAASSTITGLAAGFYTVTVTDANGCTAVQTVEVWGGECFLLADLQTVDPLCSGLANGQATALPNGGAEPYSYLWSSGSTEQTAINLAAGTYSVTVTDTNGCPFAGTVTLEDPALLTLVVDNTVHAACPNSTEGAATVIAGGGTGSVDILWSNGQSGPTASGLSTGNYTATATDANGCTATATATIQAIDQEPPMITAGATTLALGPSGSVELMLQNLGATVTDNCGVAEVFIVPQGFDCTQLGEQQVTITATDDAGNSATQTLTVTVLDTEVPVLNCPGDITRCVGDNTVEYPAPVAVDNCLILGGTFELVNGLPSGSPFPQGTTTNTYTYADVSGNMGSCSFQVTVLSPLDIQLDALVHDINNQNIGSIQVTVGGSMPDYTYEWTLDGAVVATTEDLSGIGMGLYTLWVTDAAGCKKEAGPFEVTSLVETDDPDLTDRIALYPNPTSGVVFAILPDELVNSDVHFTVFDRTGRKMLEQNSSQGKRVTINLSGMASGLYSIVVRSEQGYGMHKIVTGR